MDSTVSARVPVEIKRQTDGVLKQLGSSTTELINAAYRYVLAYGKLPLAESEEKPENPQVKALVGDAARDFTSQWQVRSVLEPQSYDGANFKELLDQARGDYYARHA